MNKPQNIAIVTLTISAVVLAAMLTASLLSNETAQAGYTSVSKGDYILVPYAWNDQRDAMCVIHIPTGKMIVYGLNVATNAIEVIDSIEMEKTFSN
ncbi:MAG: hypothetical protein GXY38_02815 [Planctomycetes bacterium]|jgi:hypothetical protein|nr:hypothetical protein [Planctomycetota bacterium]